MSTREHKATILAKFYLRYSRGNHLINFISDLFKFAVLGGLGLDLINRLYGVSIPIKQLLPFTPIVVLALYLIGYIDERVGFWKVQNAYTTEELNPHLKKMGERIKKIDDKLK